MEQKTLDVFKQTVVEENELIWIKPFCDFFNLDARWQHKKIKNDPVLGKLVEKNTPDSTIFQKLVEKNTLDFGEIDKNGRILLTKKGFVRWIQLINHKIIRKDLQESFIQYQSMIFDYLYGSAQEHANARKNFTRLQKLERLYGKIGNEIKREKQIMHDHLNRKYLQTTISFPDRKQIAQ